MAQFFKKQYYKCLVSDANGRTYQFPLQLHAIEITPEREPNDRYWHSRDINLYYGWGKMTDHDFWNTITKANLYHDTFSPGYY